MFIVGCVACIARDTISGTLVDCGWCIVLRFMRNSCGGLNLLLRCHDGSSSWGGETRKISALRRRPRLDISGPNKKKTGKKVWGSIVNNDVRQVFKRKNFCGDASHD